MIWEQETLNVIGRTLLHEFSDLSDVEQGTRVTLRLVLAVLLGGLLGMEREQQGKEAGVRTHMLVSLGAALFVLVPDMAGAMDDAMSRVIQGVVAGVGFLGAGTILKSNRNDEVKGLTTAAGVWLTAAIGVTIGLGHEATALLAAVMAFVILHLVPSLMRRDSSGS
ncbi:MgtC/SapB family protein [Pseudomonas neustonica]|jgi:putative Mg2+ transporter-C (MgtC) family protein|uniref:Protein MgtC n=1 Tax=Pseudomonas neustonica TaxID=2487346 RepID=A0ABX9XKD3_9PSED|nr:MULTISPECIES: MgtC/SapB family protein [Pseudomonas]MAB24868.1 methyltransferase [Pseudomonadales bacterium]MBA6418635.1 MgtC/SapB family protein [Pseudomonas sp. 5Ae-yellow]ROZ85077.1 MgtC/SapB family protein [Pseudomonas sp. SSM44]ROZ86636.1 MgtC/SapB family protein [Pseudomonas neustonica]|tara:strand:+ start:8844 stop:9341 length:498 start_codon:yes stop_codon:yes gene_type:complete